MMTKPLLAILLLLPLSVSARELDGKAIICPAIDEFSGWPKGIEFKSGGVVLYWVNIEGTSAVLHQRDEGSRYTVSTKKIRWGGWTLNRETLAVQHDERNLSFYYQCELADSPKAMLKTLEAARLEMQRKTDEKMSNNKI